MNTRIAVRKFFSLLRRNVFTALLAFLIPAGGILGYVLTRPVVYTATSQLLATSAKAVAPDTWTAFFSQQMATYPKLATSASVLDPTIQELKLQTTPDELIKNISVSNPKGTFVINVGVSDTNPTQAARIANAISTHLRTQIESNLYKGFNNPAASLNLIVTQKATPPAKPSFAPNPLLTAVSAIVAGAIICILCVAVVDSLRSRFTDVVDVHEWSNHAGLTLLGRFSPDSQASPAATAAGATIVLPERGEGRANLAELATRISVLGTSSTHADLIHLVGSLNEQSKTSVLISLASALALRVDDVILVDANFTNPHLAMWLNMQPTTAIQKIPVSLPDQKNTGRSLSVMSLPQDSKTLPTTSSLSEVFTSLANNYSFIIVDTGEANSLAETCVTRLSILDTPILTVEEKRDKREEAQQFVDNARSIGLNPRLCMSIESMSHRKVKAR